MLRLLARTFWTLVRCAGIPYAAYLAWLSFLWLGGGHGTVLVWYVTLGMLPFGLIAWPFAFALGVNTGLELRIAAGALVLLQYAISLASGLFASDDFWRLLREPQSSMVLPTAAFFGAGQIALWAGIVFRPKPRKGPRSCRHCGYSLRGTSSSICPECGREVPDFVAESKAA